MALARCRSCVVRRGLQWTLVRPQSQEAMSPKQCHYRILSLKKEATQEEIKAAFVKLSKEVHPDLNPSDPTTHERFVRVNEAYSILSKTSTRREYDFSLAAQLAHRQRFAQHAGSHSAGGSNMPGSGTYHGSDRERIFWDETIMNMRDRSQDKTRFYDESMYYGVRGVKRLSNTYIIAGCFVLMGIGILMHLVAIKYSKHMGRVYRDEQQRIAHGHLTDARRRAREHGNVKQLELLKARWKEQETAWQANLSSSSSSQPSSSSSSSSSPSLASAPSSFSSPSSSPSS